MEIQIIEFLIRTIGVLGIICFAFFVIDKMLNFIVFKLKLFHQVTEYFWCRTAFKLYLKEQNKIKEIEKLLIEWDTKQNHDACWYYPEIFKKIGKVLGLNLKGGFVYISKDEFCSGCKRFQDEHYNTNM